VAERCLCSRLIGSAGMSRYYFDLRDGEQLFVDEEGTEMPDLEAVQKRSPNHWQRWLGTR
jgi:hypothetical protein